MKKRPPVLKRALSALRAKHKLTEPQARALREWGAARGGKTANDKRLYRNWRRRVTRKPEPEDPETAVSKAYALRKKLLRKGEDPDLIRVFFKPNAGLSAFQRRYTLASWKRFMEKDEYRNARTEAIHRGTFVLGRMDQPDGRLEHTFRDLLRGNM